MEVKALIRILPRRWWLIALPVVISAGLAAPDLFGGETGDGGGFATQIRYSAAQRQNMPQREGDYTDVWLASEYTVDAFTAWARAASFRAEISSALGEPKVSLAGLRIAADNARNVGVVYLSHGDRESLRAIADAAVLVLSDRNQNYFPQLGGEAAQVTILEAPSIVASPPALPSRFAPILRLCLALLIGLALAFAAEYFDSRIYHQDELRRMGLPLLGSIPKERA